MCARYYIAEDGGSQELREIVEAVRNISPELKTAGEIFPSDTVPVIANSRKLEPHPFAMKWGYLTSSGRLVINARSETASNKPMFRDGMAQRRCIIPASWYFEWEKRDHEKTKYAIRSEHSDEIYMAGLYRMEYGRPVFTVLTRAPADPIAFIHDRMPVIFPKEMITDWLNPRYSAEELLPSANLSVSYLKSS